MFEILRQFIDLRQRTRLLAEALQSHPEITERLGKIQEELADLSALFEKSGAIDLKEPKK